MSARRPPPLSLGGYDHWKTTEPDPYEFEDPEDDGDWEDEYDPGDDCGRWDQNAPGGMSKQCRLAGTEFCDFECPYRN